MTPTARREFMEVHVPEHLHDMVDHYKDAVSGGGQ